MMRGGQLLAEDSPTSLLERMQMDNLENVFLKLCVTKGDTENMKGETLNSVKLSKER